MVVLLVVYVCVCVRVCEGMCVCVAAQRTVQNAAVPRFHFSIALNWQNFSEGLEFPTLAG